MHEDLRGLCLRLEGAQAAQNAAYCEAGGGAVLRLPGGTGVYYGPAHFMNQGLALGLAAGLAPADLAALEAHLAPKGGEVVLEVAAGADAPLFGLLSERGYRLRQFQQVWRRALESRPAAPGADIRPAVRGRDFGALVMAGFMGADDPAAVDASTLPSGEGVSGSRAFVAFVDGVEAGGGSVSVAGGVAVLSGTSVLPRFRGRGLQRALIAARLSWAHDAGAREACSVTLPGTASQRSLEWGGFRAAYPKVEMVRPGP